MTGEAAHESRWETSDVVFGIPFLIAIALQWVFPLALFRGMYRLAFIPVGVILGIVGILCIVLARREFAHHHQPTDPGRPTGQIVSSGIFSISRNPLYLGCVILLLGIALLFNAPWTLGMLVPSIIFCHTILIFPEERYLLAKFGQEYTEYAGNVHRWLGRK